MSTVEEGKEGFTSFHTFTDHYNAALVLRLAISLDGHEAEVQKDPVGEQPFLQLGALRMDLFGLAQELERAVTRHGARRVLQPRHDEHCPLFELLFTSQHALEKYLRAKQEADEELQRSIAASIASCQTDPALVSVEVSSSLFLVIPVKGTQETHMMTLQNHKQLLPKMKDSFMFTYNAKSFKECAGGIKVEALEVTKELDGVTEWLLLGLYLGLPCSRLKEIEADYPMTRSRRTEVIYTWMKRERPSWQKVVDALVGVGEGERARDLASKYGLVVPETVLEPPELAKHIEELHELRGKLKERDELLLNQTKMIIIKEESVLKGKIKVKCLKNEMEVLMREKQQMSINQSEKENALRLKNAELQLFKEMMTKQGKREDLEEIIQAKELEIAKLKEELAECEKKQKEVADESSKLRNELLQTSNELSVKRAEVMHLQDVRADNRETINSLKSSLQLQIQQHTTLNDQLKTTQGLLSSEYEAKAKEVKAYQQSVSQKEQEIAKLSSKLQEHEAVLSSLVPSLSVDRSVIEVVELRDLLGKAEEERERALRQVKALEKEISAQVVGELLEADPTKCEANGPGITTAEINTTATFKVSVVDQQNRPCTRPTQLTTRLQSRVDGSIVETAQTSEDAATYQVQYTATQRGRHQLSVAVNGVEIPGSPFGVFVSIAPTALGTPVHVIEGLNSPKGIAISRDSDVIVCAPHKITVYTMRGEKKRQFGSEGKGKGQFSEPWGVALDSDGCIYVSDTGNKRIQKFTFDGQYIKSLSGKNLIGRNLFDCPKGLKINNNKLYVCDVGNNRILIFDRELNYITHIGGSKGSGPGQFSGPHDIAWDSSSILYVADRGNGRIQVFDEDGRYVWEFGQKGRGHGELSLPYYIDVARDLVYVSEFGNDRVSVFDTSGRFVCTVGRKGRGGPGELVFPCGISVSEDHFVCVCDRYNHRVQIF